MWSALPHVTQAAGPPQLRERAGRARRVVFNLPTSSSAPLQSCARLGAGAAALQGPRRKKQGRGEEDPLNKRIFKREETSTWETLSGEKWVLPKNQEGHGGDAHVALAQVPRLNQPCHSSLPHGFVCLSLCLGLSSLPQSPSSEQSFVHFSGLITSSRKLALTASIS